MSLDMARFRFGQWLAGFVHVATGLAQIVSFGFWLPRWPAQFNLWLCDLDF